MEFRGYRLGTPELIAISLATGVVVATLSLLLNFLFEALKHLIVRSMPRGTRRCIACTEPAEPGTHLCARHARISEVVRHRGAGPGP
jgi:hypothetical protein